MISPIPAQRFITNGYADGSSVRSWLACLRPVGCATCVNHVGVHGVSAFWLRSHAPPQITEPATPHTPASCSRQPPARIEGAADTRQRLQRPDTRHPPPPSNNAPLTAT